ncbi:MAG: aspartate-semialdehyde dehydrogenase [Bdellovibrionota bacterium]
MKKLHAPFEMALKIAVVGATGAVGEVLFSILEKRNFPIQDLSAFSSPRSEGKKIKFQGRDVICKTLMSGCFKEIDLVFFDASDAVSKEWVPQATESECFVVDNSAAFRGESDIPLVVPEVNGDLIAQIVSRKGLGARQRIISGPNCTTAQLVVALKPIHDRYGLKRVVVSTYQSTSGAGKLAMEELKEQTSNVLKGARALPKVFSHQIAFNCIPQIGGFGDDGFTSEETKLVLETRKILGLPGLKMSATAVRVPTLSCHAESINIECEKSFNIEEIKDLLGSSPGLVIQDDPSKLIYPLGVVSKGDPVHGAAGQDSVYVGRVRKDLSVENGLHLWIVSDNLRKGAALNAVQIGELLIQSRAEFQSLR